MGINSLTFSATEYIRQQLLSRNLDINVFGGVEANTTPTGTMIGDAAGTEKPGSVVTSPMRDMAVVDQLPAQEMSEFFIDQLYLANKYGPVGGFDDLIEINTVILNNANLGPYSVSVGEASTAGITTHNSIGSCYKPGQILLGVTAEGLLSDPDIIDDTLLQQLGAVQLKKEFQYRLGQELEQQTIGRANILEAFKDPFMAVDILRGEETFIERDWHITMPKSLIGKGLDFVSRLTGFYLPFSYIPGDYFELEPPRGDSFLQKVVSDVTGLIGSTLGIPRRRQSPSQRFLEYTGGGQKSQLFKHIKYNRYGPQYGEGAQAQTAIGRVFGEIKDFIGGGILGAGNYPPNPPQYVGSSRNNIPDMTSPASNNYAGENYVKVFGPSEVAKDFDENQYKFGTVAESYTSQGSVGGGFSWYNDKSEKAGIGRSITNFLGITEKPPGPQKPGVTQGPGGSTDGTTVYTNEEIPSSYYETQSTSYEFREGSIMDVTQKITESVPGSSKKLQHVGHAINQVSKVFNDGYKELTKGSRVRRYENTDPIDMRGIEVGREYCRIWTKDIPYWKHGRLQKTETNHRKETYSVLDSPFNLNIAPWRTDSSGNGSSNIVDGKVKKYMFSIENLSWRTSREKGFTYSDLPPCEKGPNGGRIMWFPPYDLSIDENSNANWSKNDFIGRTEPVYSYNNSDRTGTLKWKLIVDHPSIMNMLVRKELAKLTDKEIDNIVDSFHAGCKTYDIYDLARKWGISVELIREVEDILENETDKETVMEIITPSEDEPEVIVEETPPSLVEYTSPPTKFFFENDCPNCETDWGKTSDLPYNELASTYYSQTNIDRYKSKNPTQASQLTEFFSVAKNEYDVRYTELMVKIHDILKDGKYIITLDFAAGCSNLAPTAYNENLSYRRLDSVRQMFEAHMIGGEAVFKEYTKEGGDLIFPDGGALGESACPPNVSDDQGNLNSIYNASASDCRYAAITGIKIEKKTPDEETKIPVTPITQIRKDRPDPLPPTQKPENKVRNTRRIIANKLLQRMVTECDYFDIIKKDTPFIYDSLREKFKYFQPAFHSMTPEGLNSRLTFLNQCLRPGATIPVVKSNGELDTEHAAKNTAFGAPPVCVMRIGDFYNTKIVINNMSISYDDNLFDLNPEGIGVQPMIATVSLTFNYIGGSGLKGPVDRLQNALSFNYYGNTEMYDERAVMTVTDDDPDEQAWLKENQDWIYQVGADLENEADEEITKDTSPNDGQTIGDRDNTVLTTSGETGNVKYSNAFNDYKKQVATYMSGSINEIKEIMTKRNYGWLQLIMAKRQWKEGLYDIDPINSEAGNLIGQPVEVSVRLNEMFDYVESQIKSKSTYIQTRYSATSPGISKNRKMKKFLLKKLEEVRPTITAEVEAAGTNLGSLLVDLTPKIEELNIVNSGPCDGFVESGKVTVLSVSGLSTIHESSKSQTVVPTNTLDELNRDYSYINHVSDYFTNALNGSQTVLCVDGELPCVAEGNVLNSLESGSLLLESNYTSPSNFDNFMGTSLDPELVMEYIMFSDQIVENSAVPTSYHYYHGIYGLGGTAPFWDELISAIGLQSIPIWLTDARQVISSKIMENEDHYLGQLYAIEKQIVDRFVTSDNDITEGIVSLGTSDVTTSVSSDKERNMSYVKASSASCDSKLLDLSTQANKNDDTFNYKFNRQ
jgi:hypothetical protein